MKTKEVIIEQQKEFIMEMKDKTSAFLNSIDKSEIETILLLIIGKITMKY